VGKISTQQQLPFLGQSLAIQQIWTDLVKPPVEEFVDLQLAVAEFGPNLLQKGMDAFSGSAITRAVILMERWSLMRLKGRAST